MEAVKVPSHLGHHLHLALLYDYIELNRFPLKPAIDLFTNMEVGFWAVSDKFIELLGVMINLKLFSIIVVCGYLD